MQSLPCISAPLGSLSGGLGRVSNEMIVMLMLIQANLLGIFVFSYHGSYFTYARGKDLRPEGMMMDITKNTLCGLLRVPIIKPNNYFQQAVLYSGDHSYGHRDLCCERQKESASYPEQRIRISKPGTSEGRQL